MPSRPDRRHVQATDFHVGHVFRVRRRCRSAGGGRDGRRRGAGSHSLSIVRPSRNNVTYVARACNFHAHAIRHIRNLLTPELAVGTYSGVQSDNFAAGLLKRCVVRCSSQQYSEAATPAEHCGADRSSGAKEATIVNRFWNSCTGCHCQSASGSTTCWPLNTRSVPHTHIHTILPQRSYQTSGIYTSTPFIHASCRYFTTTRTHCDRPISALKNRSWEG